MNYSKGITWFDDCRIPFEDTPNAATNPKYRLEGNYKMPEKGKISEGSITQFRSSLNEINTNGRFPPNLLVSDDMLNDGTVSKTNTNGQIRSEKRNWVYTGKNKNNKMSDIKDKGSNSRYYDIDLWFNNLLNNYIY